MVVENVLHMNAAGDGKTSYANNSLFQETVMAKTKPILEETIKNIFSTTFPTCFKAADLGCSSGPNTLLLISEIIDTVYQMSQQRKCKSPEFQVFLNDLPGNDFSSIFKYLPFFYEVLKKDKGDELGPCFISGLPGSFYGRLFPVGSIHFIHSSYSLHWLSKVPDGLVNNKGNIFIAETSPPDVFKAYLEQFQKDFSLFLSLRSEEMVPGGRMVLTFNGRSIADPTCKDCCLLWDLLTKSLFELVSEELVEEADVDSFNIPFYTPFEGEVREIVQKEGSFSLDKLEVFEIDWDEDVNNKYNENQSEENLANCIRAVTEPMLASHFGDAVIDNLFERYAKHLGEDPSVEKTKCINIVISITKM